MKGGARCAPPFFQLLDFPQMYPVPAKIDTRICRDGTA
jgi:hypothetical protein